MAKPIIPTDRIPADLIPVITALCEVGRDVAGIIARGPLAGALGAQVGDENADGDQQKALDVMADEMFEAALRDTEVKYYASEEQEIVLDLGTGGYALAIDPLDGSSNIDVNVSIGTIFSIFEAGAGDEESFLRTAREQICGGYIVYGPATALVVTFGDGVQMYTLNPETRAYVLTDAAMTIPAVTREFAINASNHRHWMPPVKAYIEECLAGETGPRGKNFNMRWVGSLVAEAHRILTRGGAFLYPGDARDGYANGRLRMVYECAPMAFLVEQAGGRATQGAEPVLDQAADTLHGRIPLVFGSTEEVDRIAELHGKG